jgi:hypothetical protein
MEKVTRPDLPAGALVNSERPALASVYAVAGRFICAEAVDDDSALLLRRYFAGWHVSRLADARGIDPDATLTLKSGQALPHAPRGFETFETAGGGICYTDGRTYFFQSNGSVVRVGGDSPKRIEVWIGADLASRERAALARLIFDASMTAMRRCGLFELHGAGLVEPLSGDGVLIVGPSGSGKSTLATQLASVGWRYLSDDSLLLYEHGPAIEARALRREFALTERTVAAGVLEGYEDRLETPAPFDPQKRRFEPQAVFPDRFVESSIPRAVFFPAVTHEASSRVLSLSQAETMRRLIRMCPWACYDKPAAKAYLDVLAGLARQAVGFELQAGRDLFGNAGFASDFMRGCVEGEEK